MPRDVEFRSIVVMLWFRLMSLGIFALVFAEALVLVSGEAQGWSFYLTIPEVAFEGVVRLIFAALAGVALGTLCTAVIAPFLWHYRSSRERLADWATKAAVVPVIFLIFRFAVETLIRWSHYWFGHHTISDIILHSGYFLAFVLALCIPRSRKELVTSLDGFLSPKMTRRTVIATLSGTAAVVATEFALSRQLPIVRSALAPQRPRSNFLLVTFDALSAEDMSLYGYRLPTTPNINAFARKGTIFTNFYSGSTFTTPCIATIMTGLYPSENHVYQIEGVIRGNIARRNLPHAMRSAGYATGAFFSNPWAYYLSRNVESEFDVLPEPIYQPGLMQDVWKATSPLHQDSGVGYRGSEYKDLLRMWDALFQTNHNADGGMQAAWSFEQAGEVLDKLPDGFFLWIHILTPHEPYRPAPEDWGRFLPDSQLRTVEEVGGGRWAPHYAPDQQNQVDQRRLRYDEFMATGDRAFGAFMSDLENRGKLENTTVLVAADHGESFEGGVYQHGGPYQTRPVIHVPLIIRTPGQQTSRTVSFTADETALAPTILELAGVPKPEWMRGQSLVGWLDRNGRGEGEGLAFCQYLERNSVFKPVRHGTVGIIDGRSGYQYVLDLDTQKGALRPLNEAQVWNLDRSAENPARAEALRAAIYARFPELVPKTT